MNRVVFAVAVLYALVVPSTRAQEVPIPDDAAIRAILTERIDSERRNVGIVVGVVEPSGERIIAHGTFSTNDPRSVDRETVFEIGSITKVFTSLLLADMVERGEVKLDDPVAKYLPATVRVPERDGRVITLQDLATHTSGLPRLPTNLKPVNIANPYADYTANQLYEFLTAYELPRAIGAQYEYSNLGGGLLGHALALRAGAEYEKVLRDRILTPLKMTDTGITLKPDGIERLARGHNRQRLQVSNWDFLALAGAGALRSTAQDLSRLLGAFVSAQPNVLTAAIRRMRSIERPGPLPNSVAVLGWQIMKRPDFEIIWHDGGTAGYSSFIGYVPSRSAGVVVLSNMLAGVGVQDIGFHLLDSRIPLSPLPVQRTRITLPAEALGAFVGRYQLSPGFIATVTQEGDRLFLQPTNQPRHEIFAEGPRSFFATIVDAQFVFEVDEAGRGISMTLLQGGAKITGKRLPE
jgi:CubicO group peptidase (beta-lactamase class C family)